MRGTDRSRRVVGWSAACRVVHVAGGPALQRPRPPQGQPRRTCSAGVTGRGPDSRGRAARGELPRPPPAWSASRGGRPARGGGIERTLGGVSQRSGTNTSGRHSPGRPWDGNAWHVRGACRPPARPLSSAPHVGPLTQSAECHVHSVEVTGSNPVRPTTSPQPTGSRSEREFAPRPQAPLGAFFVPTAALSASPKALGPGAARATPGPMRESGAVEAPSARRRAAQFEALACFTAAVSAGRTSKASPTMP